MENHAISASLSTQSLTFRPDKPVAFEVTVINSSNQFAAFQLEVLAAGSSKSGPLWYRLSPEVAAAKPPGGITVFQVVIFDSPLTAFVGVINLTVRIFSPQLRQERKLLVRSQHYFNSCLKILAIYASRSTCNSKVEIGPNVVSEYCRQVRYLKSQFQR